MGNCGYTQEQAEEAFAGGYADLIAFGRPFISNPDLVERFKNGWPLAEPAPMSEWYSPIGAKGYTDFPAYREAEEATSWHQGRPCPLQGRPCQLIDSPCAEELSTSSWFG